MIEIVYESKTGATEQLAQKVKTVFASADLKKVTDNPTQDSEIYFLGSWCDKGTMTDSMKAFAQTLHQKKIFVFGTCGFGSSDDYFRQIGENMVNCIPEDNEILGYFICQGQIDEQFYSKYENMLLNPEKKEQGEEMLKNYEQSKGHPTEEDCMNLEMKLCTLDITLNDAK